MKNMEGWENLLKMKRTPDLSTSNPVDPEPATRNLISAIVFTKP
jgi:hypothetical protein